MKLIGTLSLLLSCLLASADYNVPSCGGKQTIVNLFEWRWADVAQECKTFLGPAGYCAVQVSPPNEHLLKDDLDYPWWQRYQPISYKLVSRSGDRDEFTNMVNECNKAGVRIIVDAVINHMAGMGQSGQGSGGSDFNSNVYDFPGVPYGPEDFTPASLCPSVDGQIHDFNDANEVRNCQLVGLTDLYQARQETQDKVTAYLNDLIDLGVMGFRIDAAKHMWPKDLEAIQSNTHDLNTDAGFDAGTRPFFFHEIIDLGNEVIKVDDYFDLGIVTEFRYCYNIARGINAFSELVNLYDPSVGMAPSKEALVFVDNHDNQRGHGSAGDVLTFNNGVDYKMAVAFTLAQDYGFTRIMSSYMFDNSDQGPPGTNGVTDSVEINADGSCGGGWVCEHRWNTIAQMVKFRNAVSGTTMANWFEENDNVAFGRGDQGFFAMSKAGSFTQTLQTGLAAGDYCDLITNCSKTITVADDGTAEITIQDPKEPLVAICVGCSM